MPKFKMDSAADCRQVREKARDQWRAWQARLTEWREVRDRRMDKTLEAFKSVLHESYQQAWHPYQGGDVDAEIQTLKQIANANELVLELVSKTTDAGAIKKIQQMEDALDALIHSLRTAQVQADSKDAAIGEGRAVLILDCLRNKHNQAAYADREGLQKHAEAEDDDEDDTPRKRYKESYKKHGDHDKAYVDVMEQAEADDGPQFRIRVPDNAAVDVFMDGDDVWGVIEYGEKDINPLLEMGREKGLKYEDGKFVVGDAPALSDYTTPEGQSTGSNKTTYCRIQSKQGTYLYVDQQDQSGDGVMVNWPNPFGGQSAGAYVLPGNSKARGNPEDRYEPVVLALLVEQARLNIAETQLQTLATMEAARGPYRASPIPTAMPMDPTQSPKGVQVKGANPTPAVAGEIKRVEGTDLDMVAYADRAAARLVSHQASELLSGSGSADESAAHLARLQTVMLTKLVPLQDSDAEVWHKVAEDLMRYCSHTGEDIVVPWIAPGARKKGDPPRVAEMRRLTPEMAKLPVIIAVSLEAETPESKAGKEQLSLQRVEAGVYGMTRHREVIGDKDPMFTEQQLFVDQIVSTVGAQFSTELVLQALKQAQDKFLATLLEKSQPPAAEPTSLIPASPPTSLPPAAGVPPMMPDPMMPDPGMAMDGSLGMQNPLDGSPVVQTTRSALSAGQLVPTAPGAI